MSVQCVAPLSPDAVTTAFLGATPYINRQILDLSAKKPNFMIDMPEMVQMGPGEGSSIEQLVFRASMPEIERGLDKFALQMNNSGCVPCNGPDCSYHWTEFPASAWERKRTALAERQFKTPAYCVKDVQTTRDYEMVFEKIVETMYKQTQYFKEMNITMNLFVSLAKKYVVDGRGPVPNVQNPYIYPSIGTSPSIARLSALNINLLEWFYEAIVPMPDCLEYDVQDGAPLYGLACSRQLISHMYRDDPALRWDARYSGAANNLLSKYNFQSTIRGMFIPAAIQYPRRFNIVTATGAPEEVLPTVNGIPGEVGTFTGPNPAYLTATHEEVLIFGMNPFKIAWRPTVETLGANSDFGPEPGFMDYWQWINPQTPEDPFRRVGYFATGISLGLMPQYSEGLFAILVERPYIGNTAVYNVPPACPPTIPSCSNNIPAQSCPCPIVLSVTPDGYTANKYNFTLGVPLAGSVNVGDVVNVGIATGGYIAATTTAIASGRLLFAATVAAGTVVNCNDQFTTLFCDNTLGCYADAEAYVPNCTNANYVDVTLSNPIKAVTATNVVVVYFGDGTNNAAAQVVTANMSTLVWTLNLGSAFCDQHGGVIGVCVPPGTDATCPTCGFGPTVTQCS